MAKTRENLQQKQFWNQMLKLCMKYLKWFTFAVWAVQKKASKGPSRGAHTKMKKASLQNSLERDMKASQVYTLGYQECSELCAIIGF